MIHIIFPDHQQNYVTFLTKLIPWLSRSAGIPHGLRSSTGLKMPIHAYCFSRGGEFWPVK